MINEKLKIGEKHCNKIAQWLSVLRGNNVSTSLKPLLLVQKNKHEKWPTYEKKEKYLHQCPMI
jgi:hypothetical protein